MGAFSGSMSYKLFFVQGELPGSWREPFLERIGLRAFEELTADGEDEESYGWVPIERPLERTFQANQVVYQDYLNLGFRRDKYAIPTDLFKAQLAAVTRTFLAQNQQERLTRMQRDDLKKMVRNDLKRRTLPTMKVTDMSWNIPRGELRFWSQSNKLGELFQGYFEDTFGLKLLPAGPYISAVQLGLEPDDVAALADVEPTNFVEGRVGLQG